jgi:hypothetical protein
MPGNHAGDSTYYVNGNCFMIQKFINMPFAVYFTDKSCICSQ